MDMKNIPSNRPLNGSISLSSSWRYSLSARTTPARNVPRAGESPTAVMSSDMPTTMASAAATKISLTLVAAMVLKMGLLANLPIRKTDSTASRVTAICIYPGSDPISKRADSRWPPSWMATVARKGRSASMGMTARSWKRRTEKMDLPVQVFISPFSRRVCSTIAVEERDRVRPTATACCHGRKMRDTPVIAILDRRTCVPPIPSMGVRICQSRDGLSSRPTRKSIITTPNSVKCITSSTCPIRERPKGPMMMPAIRYPKTEPRPNLLARGTAMDAAARKINS